MEVLPKIFDDLRRQETREGTTFSEGLSRLEDFSLGFVAIAVALLALLLAILGILLDARGRMRAHNIESTKLREYPECTVKVTASGKCVLLLNHENKEPLYIKVFVRWRQYRRRRPLWLFRKRGYDAFSKEVVGPVSIPQVIGAAPKETVIPLFHLQRLQHSTSKIWVQVEVSRDNDHILARSYQSPFDGSFAELQALQEENSRRRTKRRASKR
jgi:hypothetical protein